MTNMNRILAIILFLPLALFGQTRLTIGVGNSANDGTGDSLRTAMQKANTNFSTLWAAVYTNGVGKLGTSIPLIGNTVIDGGAPTYDFTIQDVDDLSVEGTDTSLTGIATMYLDGADFTTRATTAYKLISPMVYNGNGVAGGALELVDATEGNAEFKVNRVSSVAALKALGTNTVQSGGFVATLGYYSAGDGGHGVYRYDSASAATADDGSVIAPTHGTGRFLLLSNGQFNVRQFGAKGDGVANDLAAFRAAIAAINSAGGGTLFVPNGTFGFDITHSGSFNFANSVQLCGNLSIVMSAGTKLKVIGSWSSGESYALLTIAGSGLYSDANNIFIDGRGATIEGIHPNQANDPVVVHGLLFNDQTSTNITVRNLVVKDFGTCAKFNGKNISVSSCIFSYGNNNCVAVTDAQNVTFTDCHFVYCYAPPGGNCVQAGADIEANAGENVENVTFVNCTFKGNGSKGLYFQQGAGTSSRVSVVGCDIEDNADYGLAIVGTASSPSTRNVVSGCRLSGNGTSGIVNASALLLGYCDWAQVNGNVITGNSSSYGIRLTFCKDTGVVGNTVNGAGGTANVAAIYQTACRGVRIDNNIVTGGAENGIYLAGGSGIGVHGNTVAAFGKELIYFRSDVTDVVVSDNVLAECCQTANSQYVLAFASEQAGLITFKGNVFTESLRYIEGTVSAYSAGTPSITFATLASGTDDFYNGAYVLIGAERILITDYVGSTRVATLASAFAAAPTPGSSTYRVVSARTPTIGINSANADNGRFIFGDNDFYRAGTFASFVPYFATTATTLETSWPQSLMRSTSAAYTASLLDDTILVDASGASRTITLPAVGGGRSANKTYTIIKTDASANTVIVDANASETISGATTQTLTNQWDRITIRADSSAWYILSR